MGIFVVGDCEVVDIVFVVYLGGGDVFVWVVFFGIFGEVKVELGVEFYGVLYFGGKDVEMIELLWMVILVEIVVV